MAKLEDVKFTNDEKIDWDTVGEQGGGRRGPLPLGDYVFQLPSDLRDAWSSPFEIDGKTYVSLFAELTVVAGGDGSRVGETRKYLIGGFPRNRAKAGQPEVRISDLEYFYKNGFHTKEELKTKVMPGSFKALCEAVQKELGGKRFQATVEWEGNCDKKNVRNVFAEDNSVVPDPEGKMGCGTRYYSGSSKSPIPRNPEDGSFPFVFQCSCGGDEARVAVWSNDRLGRFRKVE